MVRRVGRLRFRPIPSLAKRPIASLADQHGLDESVHVALRNELGYKLSAPVVEGYVGSPELGSQPVRLLGVDPFAEPPFRSYLGGEQGAIGTDLGAF